MLQPINQYALYLNLTASGLVYTGPGTVQGIVVNSHTSGAVKLWDNTAGSTTVLTNTFTFPTGSGSYNWFGAKFKTGLYATITGTADITIMYAPYQG